MKKRITGIDIIKTLASFLVITLHTQVNYFDTASFKTELSARSLIFYAIRYISMSCVPLFLISTGYLQSDTEFSKKFYIKIKNILIPYFVITAMGKVYFHATNQHSESIKDFIYSYLGYSSNAYSWYVAMFTGLYIMIPFLNTLYKNLENRQKSYFLLALIIFTILPSVQESLKLPKTIPDFWVNFYPITYYFTGTYIKDFKLKISGRSFAVLFSLSVFLPIFLQYTACENRMYTWYIMNGFNSLSAYFISITLFVFLYEKKRPKLILFRRLSTISLYIYLVSFYVDQHIWAAFLSRPSLRIIIAQAAAIYVVSSVISAVIHKILRKTIL